MSIKVGVIGVGYLGQHHARIYAEIEGVHLVGVADVRKERAESIARQYRCEAVSDYREILDAVDALSIVTPTTTHYPIALDCLKAGKDILVEKPITVTVEEADHLIREAGRAGCIIQVGHLERYNPAVLAASDFIKEPIFIESERLSPFLGRGTDVDVTLDLMIHDIDIILSLVGRSVTDIRAVGASVLSDKLDVAKAWLEFENGCTALATVSRLSPEKQRKLKVSQRDAYIVIDYQASEIKRYRKSAEGMSMDVVKPERKESLKEELRDFVHCVMERKRPMVSGVEGRNALRVVMEITEKIKL